MNKNGFAISNIAGGDYREFRLVRRTLYWPEEGGEELSNAAIAHAKDIGFGGPVFDGPAADKAYDLWSRYAEDAQ